MLDDTLKLLRSMDLFAGLDADALEKLALLMHRVKVSEGEVLSRQGAQASAFYVVTSGNFMVYLNSGEAFTLHKPGGFIGWAVIAANSRYLATGMALTDGEVLIMYRDDFLELIRRDAALGDKLMKHHSRFVAEKMPYLLRTESSGNP